MMCGLLLTTSKSLVGDHQTSLLGLPTASVKSTQKRFSLQRSSNIKRMPLGLTFGILGSLASPVINPTNYPWLLFSSKGIWVATAFTVHSRKVGTWIQNDSCWYSFFLWFGVRGRSCSNFPASTAGIQHIAHPDKSAR